MNPIDPDLRISSATLAVSDLGRSSDFYEQILGLPVQRREPQRVLLGERHAQPALVLSAIEHPQTPPPGATGLFHIAWLHRTRAGLAETVRRVLAGGQRFEGASDHGVSEALYLSDPDGLGIELYVDRPRERWERPSDGRGVNMVTLPLDIEDLLAQFQDEPGAVIEPDTHIGHVHLKVSDVDRAGAFYADQLGFEEQAHIPSAAFLSAGGYHHHVGLNSWQSAGGSAPPDNASGLRRVQFTLSGEEAVDRLERQLSDAGGSPVTRDENGSLSVRDPDGQLLTFTGG